jgi:uncharacterized protein
MTSRLQRLARIAPLRLVLIGFPVVLALGLTFSVHFAFLKGRLPLPYSAPLDAVAALVGCAAMLGLYAGLVRVLEARWPAELAPRAGARWALLGIVVGFLLFNAVCAVFTLLGVVTWGGFNGLAVAFAPLLMAAIAAVGEELVFRGVLYRVLEDSLGTSAAVALSAALFGLLHAGNPGATMLSNAAIALEAGVMLALAYAWSRSLWLVIGIHFAWNFTEGGVYGAAVSGVNARGIVRMEIDRGASALVTGGAFGPEASLVALAVCLAAGVVFGVLAVRAGQWRRRTLRWRLACG